MDVFTHVQGGQLVSAAVKLLQAIEILDALQACNAFVVHIHLHVSRKFMCCFHSFEFVLGFWILLMLLVHGPLF